MKVLVSEHGYPLQARPGYHGEITIDPASGSILRLTLIADLIADDPMSRADLMVEYGSVAIGGRTYVCPVKSVALTTASQQRQTVDHRGFISHAKGSSQTLLNDVAFEHYHVLRSEARILNGPTLGKIGINPNREIGGFWSHLAGPKVSRLIPIPRSPMTEEVPHTLSLRM